MNTIDISEMSGNLRKLHSLFNIFPVGMLIYEKVLNHDTNYELKFINDTALKIFGKGRVKSKSKEEEIKDILKNFKKLKNFTTLSEVYLEMNDDSEENLYNRIFHSNFITEEENETCERYISKEIMIYVKIKTHQDYKLVSIENFNDERIAIQNNIIKNIKTQYLLTLSHELNNPLNSLTHSINEIISTKEEKKENKKFLNAIRINIKLIKFFIKNFIFSLKMSFDKNTIINIDKVNVEKLTENCLNLEYVFKMVKEKYSIFFNSKRIKLECNFNQMENIYVTYDYDYFKSMIKNIFMYLFYRLERNGGFNIELKFEKELKILFKKNFNKGNHLDQRTLRKTNQLDTSFVSEINIESSVKTLKILNDIINKFAGIMGIRLRIIEDESPCYLILYLKYQIEQDNCDISQELAEELTYRDSKRKNTILLNRSISEICRDTFSVLNKSEQNNSRNYILNTKNDYMSDYSISLLNDSNNLSYLSYTTNNKNKHESFCKDIQIKSSEKTKKSSRKVKKNESSLKINRFKTNVKNFKQSVSMKSEKDSEDEKKLSTNAQPKKIFLRSNFTFKYTNINSEDEVDLKVDLVLDKQEENCNYITSSSNQLMHSRSNDINGDRIIKNLGSGGTITINNNINSVNNYTNGNNFNKEQTNSVGSSLCSLKSKTKPSAWDSSSKKRENFLSSKFKEKSKNISPIHQNTKKDRQNFTNTTQTSTYKTSSKNNKLSVESIKLNQQLKSDIETIESSEFRGIDILVVDDDNFNLNVLQSMLKKLKLKIDTCMNGLECIKRLQNRYSQGIEYKLILMDVMMPIMDGIEASTKIDELVKNSKLNKNIKIIIISAHNDQEIISRAIKLSVVKEFLSKPVKQGDVERIINSYYH